MLWHNLIIPAGANDNMNADQKNVFEWTKKDEGLDVKKGTTWHPLFRSLLDIWKDNKAAGRHLSV